MNMKEKNKMDQTWLVVTFVIGILIEVLLFIMSRGSMLKSISNLIVMIAFFGVVAIVFLLAYRYLSFGRQLKDGFSQAVLKIRMLHSDQEEDLLGELCEEEILFGEKHLDAAFQKFKDELNEVYKTNKQLRGNIQEYINRDIIDEVIHAHFLSQVSGIMTGLGILGTFIGLSIGLNSFDLTGNAAEVEGKIQSLMEGIKVAFHTSVCGLIYSLLFNYFYRETYADLGNALDEFLELFSFYVIPSTDDGSPNTFLKYQEQICQNADRQLEFQRESLVKQREMNQYLSTQIAEQLSEKMKEVIVPSVERMTQSVETFAKESKEYQVRGVEKIADKFIKQLNHSVGSGFGQLRDVIHDTNKWQKKSLSEMEHVLSGILNMASDLDQNSQMLQSALQHMEAYCGKMEEMQAMTISNMEKLFTQSELGKKVLKEQSKALEEMMQQEQNLDQAMAELSETVSQHLQNLHKLAQDTQSTVESIIGQMAKAAKEQIVEVSKEAQKEIEQVTSVMDAHMNTISENTAAGADKVAKGIETGMAHLSENIDTTTKQLSENINTGIVQLSQNISAGMEQLSEGMKDSMGQFSKGVQKELRKLSEDMGTQMVQASDLMETKMQQGSKAMEDEINLISNMTQKVCNDWEQCYEMQMGQIKQITDEYRSVYNAASELIHLVESTIQETAAGKDDIQAAQFGEGSEGK